MSADSLLDHPENVLNRLSLPSKARGEALDVSILPVKPPERPKRYPSEFKVLSGALGQIVPAKEVARDLGIDPLTVGRHAKSEEALVDKVVEKLKEKAAEKMGMALDEITPARLAKHADKDVRIASGVAKDMASIFEKTTPKFNDQTNVQVVLYQPQEAKEEDYEAIQIPLVVAER